MKIVVLAGGISTEREISIVSGTGVCKALRGKGHQAILVDVYCGDARKTAETAFSGSYDVDADAAYIRSFDEKLEEMSSRSDFFGPRVLELCRAADAVFLALHGENGENGKVQAAFDLLGIRYTGSGSLGSALAMDKELSKQLFRENHVPTPAGIVLRKNEERRAAAENGVGLPCVVKPSCGGSSVGVSIAHTEEEYGRALEEGFRYEDVLIVEQYIKGREFSVGIVDGEVYPVIEIAPIQGFYDYHNKYQAGCTVETCPAELSPELTKRMQEYALQAYEALRLESYGRIDVMMDEANEMYCLEANTLPGMTPTSLLPQEAAALGMDYASLCEKLIAVSLRKSN
ncbi:MAG: D-alanine--D-alanine ligase [Lachnospiraceae bacterium]|nr:D-alanine--D-alanine ligase [Lachnospiraceae bacterium]